MKLEIPEVKKTLDKLVTVESTFDGIKQPIRRWISKHKFEISKNRKFLEDKSGRNDISILNIFLRDLLVRAMSGEKGEKVYEELKETLKRKDDLNHRNYRKLLINAKYRWGVDNGAEVISDVVSHLQKSLHWDWFSYIEEAERKRDDNFTSDPILGIKNIGLKVRDLALSEFSLYYAAFDLHLCRVIARIGWLNFGFPLFFDSDLEMGNNPANKKNYLFMHRLLILLSSMTEGEYMPVDFDRIFWHFGRTFCGAKPKCLLCPIRQECPTGKYRKHNQK